MQALYVVEADAMSCHIITAPANVLKKLPALAAERVALLACLSVPHCLARLTALS